MKRLLNILCTLALLLPIGVLGQVFSPRSNGTFTPIDPYLSVPKALYLPKACDTTSALNGGKDTIGALFYDKCNSKLWFRDTTPGGHRWTDVGNNLIYTNGVRRVPGGIVKLGTGNHTYLDSTAIIQYVARRQLGSINKNLLLTNVGVDSLPAGAAFWEYPQVTSEASQQEKGLNVNMIYKEAWGDTMNLQYGGPINTYWLMQWNPSSPRFAQPGGKVINLPYTAVNSTNRLFFPRDSVNIFSGANGWQASMFNGDFAMGDTCGYNIYIQNSAQPYPLAVFGSRIDLQRNIARQRKRRMTGLGIAGYFADYKDYQGEIQPTTFQDSSYHSKIFDYYSAGEREGDYYVNPATPKSYILGISKNDTVVGFYSAPKYSLTNSVYNGYGFIQNGASDANWFGGRFRVGGVWPTRDNGWLRYNMETIGSTRTDSLFNLYQKFDSLGTMVFRSKNSPGFAPFLIDLRIFADSNSNGGNTPSGLLAFKNYTDYKTPTIATSDVVDARTYFNLSANRSAQVGFCETCPNHQYYGYSQMIMGSSSTMSNLGVFPTQFPHTIYFARNEIYGTGSTAKASGLDLVNFGGILRAGPNLDSLKSFTQFRDYGATLNTVGRIGIYSAFMADVINLSNADSTFGFYQTKSGVRNRFNGTMELPALTTGTIVTVGSNGVLTSGQTTAQTPKVTSGAGAPGTTPEKVGDFYIDTTNFKLYFSKGTSSSADWIIAN